MVTVSSLYRNPGADMMLTEDEINTTFISQAKIFHFGTLSMTQDSVRAATKKAVKAARRVEYSFHLIQI